MGLDQFAEVETADLAVLSWSISTSDISIGFSQIGHNASLLRWNVMAAARISASNMAGRRLLLLISGHTVYLGNHVRVGLGALRIVALKMKALVWMCAEKVNVV